MGINIQTNKQAKKLKFQQLHPEIKRQTNCGRDICCHPATLIPGRQNPDFM